MSRANVVNRCLRLGLVFVLVIAGGGVAVAAVSAAEPSCVRAADFGAVPNDGADDRDQLQAAINAAQAGPRCLELEAGRFHATRRPTPGADSIGSLKITGALSLRGAGEGVTVLAMLGSGTCTGCTHPKNWRLLEITRASDVSVSGLSLGGSERTGTGEQTTCCSSPGRPSVWPSSTSRSTCRSWARTAAVTASGCSARAPRWSGTRRSGTPAAWSATGRS